MNSVNTENHNKNTKTNKSVDNISIYLYIIICYVYCIELFLYCFPNYFQIIPVLEYENRNVGAPK